MWTGPARTLPFSLTVNPPESEPLPLDGTHLQDPVLPKWFFKALAGLLALVLLLAGLWALLLRPTIESAAKAAVEEPMKTAAAEASSAKEAAAQAQQGKTEAQAAAASAQTLVGQPPAPKTVTAPFSGRLEVTANPGETKTDQFKLEPRPESEPDRPRPGEHPGRQRAAHHQARRQDHPVDPGPGELPHDGLPLRHAGHLRGLLGAFPQRDLQQARRPAQRPAANHLPQRRQLRRPADESATLVLSGGHHGQALHR